MTFEPHHLSPGDPCRARWGPSLSAPAVCAAVHLCPHHLSLLSPSAARFRVHRCWSHPHGHAPFLTGRQRSPKLWEFQPGVSALGTFSAPYSILQTPEPPLIALPASMTPASRFCPVSSIFFLALPPTPLHPIPLGPRACHLLPETLSIAEFGKQDCQTTPLKLSWLPQAGITHGSKDVVYLNLCHNKLYYNCFIGFFFLTASDSLVRVCMCVCVCLI